jgi:hypothetical protein
MFLETILLFIVLVATLHLGVFIHTTFSLLDQKEQDKLKRWIRTVWSWLGGDLPVEISLFALQLQFFETKTSYLAATLFTLANGVEICTTVYSLVQVHYMENSAKYNLTHCVQVAVFALGIAGSWAAQHAVETDGVVCHKFYAVAGVNLGYILHKIIRYMME